MATEPATPRNATLLISDLHLCPEQPHITRLFVHFLTHIAPAAAALYILGDLFEYWAGDDDLADPFNASICTTLRTCAATTPIIFLPGNRDFLISQEFATASGLTLLDEPQQPDIAGTPTLLLHGDTLCTDDLAYQEFRRMVRTPGWCSSFLARPLAERKAQIAAMRQRSTQEKQEKSAAIMDVNTEAVATILRDHGYPRLIHGHTHRPGQHQHIIDGHSCTRHVLGDWGKLGNYLACDETGCHAHTFSLAA